MFAGKRIALRATAAAAMLGAIGIAPASAQGTAAPTPAPTPTPADPPKVQFTLSQQASPDATPWTEPAVLSYTIDRNGPDSYKIELNGDLELPLFEGRRSKSGKWIESASLGPSVSYKRSNASTAEVDTLALGVTGKYSRDLRLFGGGDLDSGAMFYALEGSIDYSREAVFPDRSKPPCDTNTTSVFCRKQYSESLKGNVDFYPYFRGFEGGAFRVSKHDPGAGAPPGPNRGLSYSFRPRFQIAHDEILDGAVDPTTGLKVTGGYTSVLAGAGLTISPGFIDPSFQITATGTVRQRIAASPSRRSLVDETEGRMQLSATYFITPASQKKGWRAGISVIWTEGGDSFSGREKESTIVLAFRIGRF